MHSLIHGEIEAQSEEVTCLGTASKLVAELGLEPGLPDSARALSSIADG